MLLKSKTIPWLIHITLWLSLSTFCQVSLAEQQVRWQINTHGELWSSIKINGDYAFFGDDSGQFYALDLSTKQFAWTFQTGGRIRGEASFYNNLVFFSSDDGVLYALDQVSGQPIWTHSLGDQDYSRILPQYKAPWAFDYAKSSPIVVGERVFVGTANADFHALDVTTGEIVWKTKLLAASRSTPAYDQALLFTSDLEGNTYAIDPQNGKIVWRHKADAAITSDPLVMSNTVVIGARDTVLYGLDRITGNVNWTFTLPGGSWVDSSASIAGDGAHFYIGSSDAHRIFKISAKNGQLVWSHPTSGWSWGKPYVSDQMVFVGSIGAREYWQATKPGFHVLNTLGKSIGEYQPAENPSYITGGVFGQPSMYQGHLLIPDISGKVSAIKLSQLLSQPNAE